MWMHEEPLPPLKGINQPNSDLLQTTNLLVNIFTILCTYSEIMHHSTLMIKMTSANSRKTPKYWTKYRFFFYQLYHVFLLPLFQQTTDLHSSNLHVHILMCISSLKFVICICQPLLFPLLILICFFETLFSVWNHLPLPSPLPATKARSFLYSRRIAEDVLRLLASQDEKLVSQLAHSLSQVSTEDMWVFTSIYSLSDNFIHCICASPTAVYMQIVWQNLLTTKTIKPNYLMLYCQGGNNQH